MAGGRVLCSDVAPSDGVVSIEKLETEPCREKCCNELNRTMDLLGDSDVTSGEAGYYDCAYPIPQ